MIFSSGAFLRGETDKSVRPKASFSYQLLRVLFWVLEAVLNKGVISHLNYYCNLKGCFGFCINVEVLDNWLLNPSEDYPHTTVFIFQILQIAKILNAHMNSLQWIDQNSGKSVHEKIAWNMEDLFQLSGSWRD